MSSVPSRRLPFGLSIGSIFASFIIIGGVQVLIAGLRVPLSYWIISKISSASPLRTGAIQWTLVIENLVLSAVFIACGFAIGSWLRRDTR